MPASAPAVSQRNDRLDLRWWLQLAFIGPLGAALGSTCALMTDTPGGCFIVTSPTWIWAAQSAVIIAATEFSLRRSNSGTFRRLTLFATFVGGWFLGSFLTFDSYYDVKHFFAFYLSIYL